MSCLCWKVRKLFLLWKWKIFSLLFFCSFCWFCMKNPKEEEEEEKTIHIFSQVVFLYFVFLLLPMFEDFLVVPHKTWKVIAEKVSYLINYFSLKKLISVLLPHFHLSEKLVQNFLCKLNNRLQSNSFAFCGNKKITKWVFHYFFLFIFPLFSYPFIQDNLKVFLNFYVIMNHKKGVEKNCWFSFSE